jgi:general L-amino acid transport system permease protein
MSALVAAPAGGHLSRFVRGCVSSPANIALTVAVLLVAALAIPDLLRWLVVDAVWTGSSSQACAGRDAACWIFITTRLEQIVFGTYPEAERWRVIAALALCIVSLVVVTRYRAALGAMAAGGIFVGAAILTGVFLRGGILGLAGVPTRLWGGVMLTLVIAAWTIATALPLGLMLALARRSQLPVIAGLAAGFIDIVRSLPLVGILFLVIVLFPLFVPPGWETDRLMRALIAFTVFNAANLAEVFRGGLQAVAPGQAEAGRSLGLSPWRITSSIVVPQAVAISLPGIVNVCIAIIKETTIVLIVGLFDFLGVMQAGFSDPDWLAVESVRTTGYVFAAIVFWIVCFALSRYSLALEKRLAPERAR